MKRPWFLILLTIGAFILSFSLAQAQQRRVGRTTSDQVAPPKSAQKVGGNQPPAGLGAQGGQKVKGKGATGAVGATGRKNQGRTPPAQVGGKASTRGKGATRTQAGQETTHQKKR